MGQAFQSIGTSIASAMEKHEKKKKEKEQEEATRVMLAGAFENNKDVAAAMGYPTDAEGQKVFLDAAAKNPNTMPTMTAFLNARGLLQGLTQKKELHPYVVEQEKASANVAKPLAQQQVTLGQQAVNKGKIAAKYAEQEKKAALGRTIAATEATKQETQAKQQKQLVQKLSRQVKIDTNGNLHVPTSFEGVDPIVRALAVEDAQKRAFEQRKEKLELEGMTQGNEYQRITNQLKQFEYKQLVEGTADTYQDNILQDVQKLVAEGKFTQDEADEIGRARIRHMSGLRNTSDKDSYSILAGTLISGRELPEVAELNRLATPSPSSTDKATKKEEERQYKDAKRNSRPYTAKKGGKKYLHYFYKKADGGYEEASPILIDEETEAKILLFQQLQDSLSGVPSKSAPGSTTVNSGPSAGVRRAQGY